MNVSLKREKIKIQKIWSMVSEEKLLTKGNITNSSTQLMQNISHYYAKDN